MHCCGILQYWQVRWNLSSSHKHEIFQKFLARVKHGYARLLLSATVFGIQGCHSCTSLLNYLPALEEVREARRPWDEESKHRKTVTNELATTLSGGGCGHAVQIAMEFKYTSSKQADEASKNPRKSLYGSWKGENRQKPLRKQLHRCSLCIGL